MLASTSARGWVVVVLLTLVTSIPVALTAADAYGRPGEKEVDDAALTADGEFSSALQVHLSVSSERESEKIENLGSASSQ